MQRWRTGASVEPPLLGADGRVWDGHHRIVAAGIAGIERVSCELTDPDRRSRPVAWGIVWERRNSTALADGLSVMARHGNVDSTLVGFTVAGDAPWLLTAARIVLSDAARHYHRLGITDDTPARLARAFVERTLRPAWLPARELLAWHSGQAAA